MVLLGAAFLCTPVSTSLVETSPRFVRFPEFDDALVTVPIPLSMPLLDVSTTLTVGRTSLSFTLSSIPLFTPERTPLILWDIAPVGKNGGDAEFSIELVVGFFDVDSWDLAVVCNAGVSVVTALFLFSRDVEGWLYNRQRDQDSLCCYTILQISMQAIKVLLHLVG